MTGKTWYNIYTAVAGRPKHEQRAPLSVLVADPIHDLFMFRETATSHQYR